MKKKYLLTFLILLSIASSCTPARIVKENYSNDIKTTKVKITRENKILYIGLQAIFGYDNKDRVVLWKNDSVEIDVPVGMQEFYVRSNQADRPFKFKYLVRQNEPLCLIIKPESSPIIKGFIPIVWYFYNSFKLEKSAYCN